MIHFDQVSKFYNPDIVALKDASFNIDTGEFLFIVGHSGAGKSTIIRLLIREELPTKGQIKFDDIDLSALNRKTLPLYRQKIGVVFQDYKLLENKTIKENIEFALEITETPDNEIKDTTDYLLEIVKLQDRRDVFPSQLSGGEKQRAGIARAIANDPTILIADEPTGNLDPETAGEIMELLQKINNWGTTVIIATHAKEIVDQMQKRVIRLEKGQIVSDMLGFYQNEKKSNKAKESKPNNNNEINLEVKEKQESTREVDEEQEHAEKKSKNVEQGSISIRELNISEKFMRILEESNITTIDKLLDLSDEDLGQIKGLTMHDIEEILLKLQEYITDQTQNG
ncbi:cell division ATP-binding protein FtsE [Candidatus Dojkabacteria bacterium]|nr:cell division ATP-binding protein FtsE [Candidatus Dojkabacteria bacterium]